MKSYVFSVNANDINVDCGQLGIYTINGAGTKFYGKTTIPDRHLSRDLGDDRFDVYIESGENIAKDIVQRNDEDGFFLAEGSEPKPEEIQKAIAAYKNVCVYAVRRADVLWEKTRNREVIPDRARRAARFLGITTEWLDPTAADTKECPQCAEHIKSKATKCRHCQYDFNEPSKPPIPVAQGQQAAKR